MRLQFIGCGDAFGSGGRSNTCLHVTGGHTNFLFDCGASAMPAMKRLGIDRNAIDVVLISHFHADHFGGVPFLTLDGMYVSNRTRPLIVAGPPGLKAWYERAMNAAFPGDRKLPYPLTLHEVEIGRRQAIGPLQVTPFRVVHDEKVGPCLAYRVETEGKTVAYSGDTEWVETLADAGRNADLFVCECFMFGARAPTHLDYQTLSEKLPAIGARQVVLTHMGETMLSRLAEVEGKTANDGMIVEF